MNKLWAILFCSYFYCVGSVHAQDRTTLLEIQLMYGADRLGKRSDAAMRKFRDNRLGAFIHWGLYAIPGGEWNGKVYNGAAEWLKAWAKVPSEEWMKLMDQWNPQNFDARAWAKMAKQMGVKYVKITG